MKVKYEARTEANSRLRIETEVDPTVGKMVSWVLMSQASDVQPLVDAYLKAKAKEDGGVQNA